MHHNGSYFMLLLTLAAPSATLGLSGCDDDKSADLEDRAESVTRSESQGPNGHHRSGKYDPARMFARWDSDGDGKIAFAELPGRKRQRLGQADANGDGMLTLQEIQTAHAARKAQMDRNHDGRVSDEERDVARAKRHTDHFAAKDLDNDGTVTQSELGAKRWEHLRAADADQDGHISKAELDAAIASGVVKLHRRRHPARRDVDAQK